MTAIEQYFWELDIALDDVATMRRNQVVAAVRQCVIDADEMRVFGKSVSDMDRNELDTNFGSIDYICFVADNDLDEIHKWGRLMTDLNAFIPMQKQGFWLAIAAVYDMDDQIPRLASQRLSSAKAWQRQKIGFSSKLTENVVQVYLPLLLSAACFASMVMPMLALLPAIPTLGLGIWLLVGDRGETWIATASIASGSLALSTGIGGILAMFV